MGELSYRKLKSLFTKQPSDHCWRFFYHSYHKPQDIKLFIVMFYFHLKVLKFCHFTEIDTSFSKKVSTKSFNTFLCHFGRYFHIICSDER